MQIKKLGTVAAAILALLSVLPVQAQPAPVRVCLSNDNAPYSAMRNGVAIGFDAAVVRAWAKETGREVKFVPFEPEVEKDAVLSHEVNALLSAGLCDMVSGFPLFQADLGVPTREKFRPPDYPGAPRKPVRPFVALGTLVASAPYQGMALTVVQRPDAPVVKRLGDLVGQKIGAIAGTLEGSLIAMYDGAALVPSMVSLSQIDDSWGALESGRIDAILVPTTAMDVYRARKPSSTLQAAGVQIPLGVNIGFVALAEQATILESVNRFIGNAQQNGYLERIARESGMSWQQPATPAVSQGLSFSMLLEK